MAPGSVRRAAYYSLRTKLERTQSVRNRVIRPRHHTSIWSPIILYEIQPYQVGGRALTWFATAADRHHHQKRSRGTSDETSQVSRPSDYSDSFSFLSIKTCSRKVRHDGCHGGSPNARRGPSPRRNDVLCLLHLHVGLCAVPSAPCNLHVLEVSFCTVIYPNSCHFHA